MWNTAKVALVFCASALTAQTTDPAALARQADELETALRGGSLSRAVEIAGDLDEKVQSQHRAWLVRDARERVNEVLSWLPADTESFWVNQEPFVISSQDSLEMMYGKPAQFYSVDRLIKLNGGRFYHGLANQTVRLVAAATRGAGAPPTDGLAPIPDIMPNHDVVYFYFFAAPIDPPSPDESVDGRPVWVASASVDPGTPFIPGRPRELREDLNWIALARPDMLVLTNRKDLLREILGRLGHGSPARAMPTALPEWQQTDTNASFWGLRHYTAISRPKPGDRGCLTADLPQPDCEATGVTMLFSAEQQRLELRYRSSRPLEEGQLATNGWRRQFQIDLEERGVWRLVSDVRQRGKWPFDFALMMLGFGGYR